MALFGEATPNQIETLRTIRRGYPVWEARQTFKNPLYKEDGAERSGCLKADASQYIGNFHLYADPILPRRARDNKVTLWTNEAICTAMLVERGGSVDRAFEAITSEFDMLGTRIVFSANVNGTREPKPIADQRDECRKLLAKISRTLGKVASVVEDDAEDSPAPIVEKVKHKKDSPHDLFQRLSDLRAFCEKRDADGTKIDDVGLRPFVNGASMWRQGITVDHTMDALTMHYPPDVRKELGIAESTTDHYVPEPRNFTGDIPEKKNGGQHGAIGYVEALMRARIPVLLIGGKGTGKTTLCKAMSERLFPGEPDKFGSVNCNGSLPTGTFYGRENFVEGRVEMSQFERIVEHGGVYLFDELDAADPNTLLIVNEVLANRRFSNPKTGRTIQAHENFYAMAAANTMGTGANRAYTGRERLDAASLDRWSAGRVRIAFDETLAHDLFWSIIAQ